MKMVKSLLLGTAAGLVAVAGAQAADMPVKAAPVNPCGVSRFNGGYVGGNVGGVSYTAERNDLDGYLTDNNVYSATKAAVTAGVQVGWDWQNCNKVFGVVADWNWTNAKANTLDDPNDPADAGQGIQSKLRWFSTARVRGGLAADAGHADGRRRGGR